MSIESGPTPGLGWQMTYIGQRTICMLSPLLLLLILINRPAGAELSAKDWQQDLNYLVDTVQQVHPNPYTRISREEFSREASRLYEAIPDLNDASITIDMMQLVASLKDGHSSVEPAGPEPFDLWYPLRLYKFTDGIFITAINQELASYVGTEVLRIGAFSATDALAKASTLLGADNDFGELSNAPLYLSNATAMHALGITKDKQTLTLLVKRGEAKPETLKIPAVQSEFDLSFQFWGEIWGPASSEVDYAAAFGKLSNDFYDENSALPLHLRYRSAFWHQYDADEESFYVQINYMGDSARREQTFAEFTQSVWSVADQLPIERFVLDIRYNIGGDGSLVKEFVHEFIKRDAINQSGVLFVIVGRDTFSAGVMLAHTLDEHTEATFVGEPPGAYYRHFGDATSFELPNSELTVWLSTVYHQLSSYVGDQYEMPIELPAQFTASDYFNGQDPAMDAVAASTQRPPLAKVFREHGGDAGVIEYEQRLDVNGDVPWWAPFTLDELDDIGDDFRDAERWEDALAAYQLNARRHPKHWRVWYSIADLYRIQGNSDAAIRNYRKALESDPFNNQAPEQRRRIAELEGGNE